MKLKKILGLTALELSNVCSCTVVLQTHLAKMVKQL